MAAVAVVSRIERRRVDDLGAAGPGTDFAVELAELARQAADAPGGPGDRMLRAVARMLPLAVLATDTRGRITVCYGAGLRVLGVDDDELVGSPLSSLGHEIVDAFGSVAGDGAARFRVEGSAAGTPWVLESVAVPLERTGGVVAVAFDVTGGDEDRVPGPDEQRRVASSQAELHSTVTDALADDEARFRLVADAAPIGIFVAGPDAKVEYANAQISEITGLDQAELLERGWAAAIHEDDIDAVLRAHVAFEYEGAPFVEEFRIRRADGEVRWVRARAAHVPTPGRVRTVGSVADITEFVQAERKVRESEERTRAILETAAEGIVSCDADGMIVEFNAAAERILGYRSEEVVGRLQVGALLPEESRPQLLEMFATYSAGVPARVVGGPPLELELRRRDGSAVEVQVALAEVTTSAGRLLTAMIHDTTEQRRVEQELAHRTTHDALTGLPNRTLLVAELEAALQRASRHGTNVAVLFVELDRLKPVTDSLGHRAGDLLVVDAVARLRGVVGSDGMIGRFGGEQFVLVVEDVSDVTCAVEVAAAVAEELSRPFLVGAEEAFITSNTGIVYAPGGAGNAEHLIANADVAMFRAKAQPTVTYEVFDAAMRSWVVQRRKLEIAMRHGLERDEFELYYQPVVSVPTGDIHGFEALIRWNHPELGLLAPADFIPLAEDSGLVVQLGEWVVDRACRQLAEWSQRYPRARPLRISVNLSGRQLALAGFSATVERALREHGADPGSLDLEITETTVLDDVDVAVRTLEELKRIGVNLAMDDFGTGYSSLTYLCRLPIDIVKVDRSFVSQIGTPSRDASVVSLVVGLAQTLQLEVVAEGVETADQLAHLEDLDCGYAQGFLFSRPVPAKEAEALLLPDGLASSTGRASSAT